MTISVQPKTAGGWMPNHARYEMKARNEIQKMHAWASDEQVKAFVKEVSAYAWGWRWSLAMRSNYHKRIVTDDAPENRIPAGELSRLVRDDRQVIMPDPGVDCNHYIQEELEHDTQNPARRLMKCCACGKVFWVVLED